MHVNLWKLSYCFPKWIYHNSKTEIQKRTSWSSLYNLKKKKPTRLLRRPQSMGFHKPQKLQIYHPRFGECRLTSSRNAPLSKGLFLKSLSWSDWKCRDVAMKGRTVASRTDVSYFVSTAVVISFTAVKAGDAGCRGG